MDDQVLLRIDGEVNRPQTLTFADLTAIDAAHQIPDVGQLVASRKGRGVTLAGLLELCCPHESATYLTLHAEVDDFHASVPLESVRRTGFFIYDINGQPLEIATGGPVRFYLPDHAACHSAEVDECANVKFVDRIELTASKGFDNRPQDETEHEALHQHGDQETGLRGP
ncbi:MAG: molybdopterin-dependent oxidoreductase [Pirellulales bacterium]